MNPSYPHFFEAATGKTPSAWQVRLAEDPACQSRLIDIPTGLGLVLPLEIFQSEKST